MPEKLLTLRELSEYLGVTEEKVNELVKAGVISAYRLGGELLRFRRDQIDAIRSEIDARVTETDRLDTSGTRASFKERLQALRSNNSGSFKERLEDFFYFNDFYIVSSVLIAVLLIAIFRTL